MIPISTFNLLVVVDILFIVYAVIDHRNRLYANVVIAFLAGLLAAFLGQAAMSDVVYEVVGGAVTPVNSPSIGWFLAFISLIMFAYTVFMVYEILTELYNEKDATEKAYKEKEGA
jgi:hypothetical protein